MSRLREDIRQSFITMCTRTHYPWQVKVLASQLAFNYYNVCVSDRITLGKSVFCQDSRHLSLTMCTRTHSLDKSMFWQNLTHSSITMCTNTLHLASQGFGKTSGILLYQCVPEHITLVKSLFWQDLMHSSIKVNIRMYYTWKFKVLARRLAFIYSIHEQHSLFRFNIHFINVFMLPAACRNNMFTLLCHVYMT